MSDFSSNPSGFMSPTTEKHWKCFDAAKSVSKTLLLKERIST